jgi:aspartate carbamoyltransferase catalytic subunit
LTDEFAPDPFMETIAAATGKVYPSPGAMRYANNLAAEYGEELVMKAIGYVITHQNAEPHEVLGKAEEALAYRAEKERQKQEREKAKELEAARADRQAAEMKRFQDLAEGFEPVPKERVGEIMGDMPWLKKGR